MLTMAALSITMKQESVLRLATSFGIPRSRRAVALGLVLLVAFVSPVWSPSWSLFATSARAQTKDAKATKDGKTTKDKKQPAPTPVPTPAPTPTPAPAPDPNTSTLTVEAIAAKIKQLEADTETEEGLKAKLLTSYRLAESRLVAAAASRQRAAAIKQQVESAPQQTETYIKQLDTTPALTEAKAVEMLSVQPDEIDQALTKAQADLAALKTNLTALETELKDLENRPAKAREELAAAKMALETIDKELKVPAPADEPPMLTTARHDALEARRRSRTAEVASLEQELAAHDARLALKTAERNLLTRQTNNADAQVKALQAEVNRLKREEAERARLAAEKAQREAIGKHPEIKNLADENAELSKTLSHVINQEQQTTKEKVATEDHKEQLDKQFKEAQRRIEIAGLNETLGRILRDQRNSLPDVKRFDRESSGRSKKLEDVGLEQYRIDELRRQLTDVDIAVTDIMNSLKGSLDPSQRDDIESELRKLMTSKKELLDKLGPAYSKYVNALGELDFQHRQLIDKAKEFAEFLDKRLLWIPSAPAVSGSTFDRIDDDLSWLAAPSNWTRLFASLRSRVLIELVSTVLVVALFIVLLALRRWMRIKCRVFSEYVGKAKTDSFKWTLFALATALLAALPWPLLIGFVGQLFRDDFAGDDFAETLFVRGFGRGMMVAAILLYPILALANFCGRSGLARVHLRWSDRATAVLRNNLLWLRFVVPLLALLVTFSDWQADDSYQAGLGRLAFMAAMVTFAVFIARVLHLKSGAVSVAIQRHPETLLARTRYFWYPVSVVTPVVLAGLAAIGYFYTAQQLEERLVLTVYIILLAIMVDELVMRALMLARVRLAMKQAEDKRAAIKAAQDADDTDESEIAVTAEVMTIDLAAVNEQTRQFVRGLIGVSLFLALWGVWAGVLPALGILDEIELWHQTNTVAGELVVVPITLKSLLLALLAVGLTIVGARNLPGALDMLVLGRLPLDSGTRYAISTISRYIIVGIGVVLAFGMIGLGWAQVQWLAAALTVGLGFGLQEIFANFVSGIIILIERPIRVGDTVTVGTTSGIVTRIRIRATTIIDWNRKELIVPNKSFITQDVINWTLSDPVTRLDIAVGIAYGSDTELALKTMNLAVRTVPNVIESPEPEVFFLGFGDNTLNFEVRAYVRETTNKNRTKVVHGVHMAIDKAFREKDIEIAFPQRDLHIRSSEVPINIIARLQTEASEILDQKSGEKPA